MNNILIHIPHSSYFIPNKYKHLFCLKENELYQEQIKMTDSFTNELFNIKEFKRLVFPVSRLICDVERFRNENDEEMTKQGMWVCYTKTSNLKLLKMVDNKHKQEILNLYYDKHHKNFERIVEESLRQNDRCLIIDAHSFPSVSLPYELHSQGSRPDICIGTDNFHTHQKVTEYFYNAFSKLGYNVEVNNPFCGTIVPLKFYSRDKRVNSIMLEINRSLYMDEETGLKTNNFQQIQKDIEKVVLKFSTDK